MRNIILIGVLTLSSAMTFGQRGSQGRVYYDHRPWSVLPNMSYGRVGTGVVEVQSGGLFSVSLTISDKDQTKHFFSENNVLGTEITTDEDICLDFIRSISSGTFTQKSVNHLNEAFTVEFYITAKDVEVKKTFWDKYNPTNASNPDPLYVDTTQGEINIPVEISPASTGGGTSGTGSSGGV